MKLVENSGKNLKKDLGLEKLQFTYITKIIGISINIFVVFFDSRFPGTHIPITRIKILDTFILGRIKAFGLNYKLKSFTITPPINLMDFNGSIPNNSIIIRLDICGERFNNTNLYESINSKKFEDINVKII
jgi:hypothetical protein